jgi:eukaryotic translation initiation factor 2C
VRILGCLSFDLPSSHSIVCTEARMSSDLFATNPPRDGGNGSGGGGGGKSGTRGRPGLCNVCNQRGHYKADCSLLKPNPPSAAQTPTQQVPGSSNTQAGGHPLDPWKTPGRISNTALSPEQLVIQTAIDNREDQVPLLTTLHKRGYQTDVASTGKASTVSTNFLSIAQRPVTLFVYEIEFVREFDNKDSNKPVLITKRFEREGLFAVLKSKPRYRRLTTQDNWVTDCTNIWSTTPLFDDLDFTTVPPTENNLNGINPNSHRPISAKEATVIFKRVINLQKTIGQLYRDSNGRVKGDDDPALLQRGLNAVISAHATQAARRQQTTTLQSGANKFYDTTKGFYLDGLEQVRAFHGFFISVRPGAQQLLVNINLRCSPFLRDGLNVKDLIRTHSPTIKATSTLKGIKVQLHGQAMAGHAYQGIEFITDIRDTAKGDNNDVNVGKRSPHTPTMKNSNLMTTAAKSPYRQPLSSAQTTNMINTTLKKPEDHVQALENDAIRMFGFKDPSTVKRFRDCFGLIVETTLIRLPCRFLLAPGVLYQGTQTANISKASWNLVKIKIRGPCRKRTVRVLDMSERAGQEKGTPIIAKFTDVLKRALENMGIQADVPQQPLLLTTPGQSAEISEDNLYAQLDALVPADQRSKTSLVIVIPSQSFDLYSLIKRVTDLRLGIQATCAAADRLPDFNQDFKALQHCANIGLKLNLKGDGHNHKIARNNIRELYKPTNNLTPLEKVDCDTIVIGADVTHPSGHCATACPSVAAVVGSVDNDFAKFPGSMRLQRSKTEVITGIADMVMERLLDWAEKHNDRLPGSMLFYRDGVSESQFDAVREHEVRAMQEAYDKAEGYIRRKRGEAVRKGDCPFKLTFVVVGKRHNTRFFPADPNPSLMTSNGNVKPGLVVDQVITHPYIMDFYLQSHQPIKGTGRSAHYFVLENNMNLSADRLQEITHAFCYNYARATKGVSYCGPAYYADRLCDRSRAYIRDWLIGRDGYGPSREQGDIETIDAFRDFVVNELHDDAYYRPSRALSPKYGVGRERKNPWHPNLDNIMFYL